MTRPTPAPLPPGLVAVPAVDWLWTASAAAFVTLSHALPPQSGLVFGTSSSSPAANRNDLAERFLANSAWQWVLFVDSDMTPPRETVERLLSHDVDVVGAMCYFRRKPYRPVFVGNGSQPNGDGLVAVECVGTGCLMLHRRVLETIPYPWFEHPAPGIGEDTAFCVKARRHGFTVHMDAVLCAGHVEVRPVGHEEAATYRRDHRNEYTQMPARSARERNAVAATWQAITGESFGDEADVHAGKQAGR